MVINPTPTCPCQAGVPTPAEATTWGRVKSLYVQ